MNFKKLLVALSFICIIATAKAQTMPGTNTVEEQAAGYQLRLASRHFYTGVIITGASSVLIIAGAISSKQPNAVAAIGELGYLVGLGFMIESYSHIGKAGKILMGNTKFGMGPTQSGGLGLRYNF
jgi:hypothetical protein